MGAVSNATLTINNDNSYGTLQLSAPVYRANENGGEAGEKPAKLLSCTEFDDPLGDLLGANGTKHFHPAKSDQTESNLIQPNQTN